MKVIVAVTGASGLPYAVRLLEILEEKDIEVHCIISDAARKVASYELEDGLNFGRGCAREHEIDASIASGSFKVDAMVVVPCSMKSLSAIASGFAHNVIVRAADVMIKENRKLILVPRETPLSAIHLENMLKLSRLGVTILPAMPGLYHKPKKVGDMVDFIVGKVLDQLEVENDLFKRWEKGD